MLTTFLFFVILMFAVATLYYLGSLLALVMTNGNRLYASVFGLPVVAVLTFAVLGEGFHVALLRKFGWNVMAGDSSVVVNLIGCLIGMVVSYGLYVFIDQFIPAKFSPRGYRLVKNGDPV